MESEINANLINTLESKIRRDFADFESLSEEREKISNKLVTMKDKFICAENGKVIIQKVAKEVQEKLKFQISSIVASALTSVFEDAYLFKIDFVERRGKIEADLLFVRNGEEVTPFDSAGGGVLDVTSFSLRLTFLFFKGGRKILILDEPFRFVSVDLQSRCSAMLKLISEKLKFQVIMVSHLPEIIFSADKIYTISNGKIVTSPSDLSKEQKKEVKEVVEEKIQKKIERIRR